MSEVHFATPMYVENRSETTRQTERCLADSYHHSKIILVFAKENTAMVCFIDDARIRRVFLLSVIILRDDKINVGNL